MGRILGIDFGERRIGLAISDELGITAQGLEVLERQGLSQDMIALKEIAEKHKVDKIIVGLPLDKNGNIKPSSPVIDFVTRLKENFELPIETWDERLSTIEVEKVLLAADVSRKKRKRTVDKLAAQIILQGYLDYVNQKKLG